MKFRNIAMAALFLILGINVQSQAQILKDTRQKPGETGAKMVALPDLIVKEILYEANNKIRVRVVNQGKGGSGPCHLALMMLSGGGPASPTQKVWTIEIPALQPGKGYSMPISIAPRTWADAAFKARIDRSNRVRESDENNNDLFNDDKVIK